METSGNITASQISDLTVDVDSSARQLKISFDVTGQSGTDGISNMTIPKSLVPTSPSRSRGVERPYVPVVYIDGQVAPNQGYTQDDNNFYVWFSTHFSTHAVAIEFFEDTETSPSPSPSASSTQTPTPTSSTTTSPNASESTSASPTPIIQNTNTAQTWTYLAIAVAAIVIVLLAIFAITRKKNNH
jgi:hypothetical protein